MRYLVKMKHGKVIPVSSSYGYHCWIPAFGSAIQGSAIRTRMHKDSTHCQLMHRSCPPWLMDYESEGCRVYLAGLFPMVGRHRVASLSSEAGTNAIPTVAAAADRRLRRDVVMRDCMVETRNIHGSGLRLMGTPWQRGL